MHLPQVSPAASLWAKDPGSQPPLMPSQILEEGPAADLAPRNQVLAVMRPPPREPQLPEMVSCQ
jgi:hypothetical protein